MNRTRRLPDDDHAPLAREAQRAIEGRMLAARYRKRLAEGATRPGWLLAGLAEAADADGRVIAFGPAARAFLLAIEAAVHPPSDRGERGSA